MMRCDLNEKKEEPAPLSHELLNYYDIMIIENYYYVVDNDRNTCSDID